MWRDSVILLQLLMPCAEVSQQLIINEYSVWLPWEGSMMLTLKKKITCLVRRCWNMLVNIKENHSVVENLYCIVTAVHAGRSCFRALVMFREAYVTKFWEATSYFSTLHHNYPVVVFNYYLWLCEILNHKFVLIRFQKCICVSVLN